MISQLLNFYRLYLDANIDNVRLLIEENRGADTNYIYNWLQASWELLVERMILQPKNYLEVYGEGADLYGSSSRISFSDSLPTHRIRCKSKHSPTVKDLLSGEYINPNDLFFEELVGFSDGYYNIQPPFNFVLCKGITSKDNKVLSTDYVFRFEELDFWVELLQAD